MGFAADAGLMQIHWWQGAVGRCAGTVPRSATHDTICAETGYAEKVPRRELLRELEKSDSSLARWPRRGKPKKLRQGREIERLPSVRGRLAQRPHSVFQVLKKWSHPYGMT